MDQALVQRTCDPALTSLVGHELFSLTVDGGFDAAGFAVPFDFIDDEARNPTSFFLNGVLFVHDVASEARVRWLASLPQDSFSSLADFVATLMIIGIPFELGQTDLSLPLPSSVSQSNPYLNSSTIESRNERDKDLLTGMGSFDFGRWSREIPELLEQRPKLRALVSRFPVLLAIFGELGIGRNLVTDFLRGMSESVLVRRDATMRVINCVPCWVEEITELEEQLLFGHSEGRKERWVWPPMHAWWTFSGFNGVVDERVYAVVKFLVEEARSGQIVAKTQREWKVWMERQSHRLNIEKQELGSVDFQVLNQQLKENHGDFNVTGVRLSDLRIPGPT